MISGQLTDAKSWKQAALLALKLTFNFDGLKFNPHDLIIKGNSMRIYNFKCTLRIVIDCVELVFLIKKHK